MGSRAPPGPFARRKPRLLRTSALVASPLQMRAQKPVKLMQPHNSPCKHPGGAPVGPTRLQAQPPGIAPSKCSAGDDPIGIH